MGKEKELGPSDRTKLAAAVRWVGCLPLEQRVEVFETLTDNFCPCCGQSQPDGDHCRYAVPRRR